MEDPWTPPCVTPSHLYVVLPYYNGLGSENYIGWGGNREKGLIYRFIIPHGEYGLSSVAPLGLPMFLEVTLSELCTEPNKHMNSILS